MTRMNILVLNCGSSSVKFSIQLADGDRELLSGRAEGIGEARGRRRWRHGGDAEAIDQAFAFSDHEAALRWVLELASEVGAIGAVGHRVVHGGEHFHGPVVLDSDTLRRLRDLDPLAPLHNPHNRAGIGMALQAWPDVPQVAVFDTAFHHALPEHAYRYAVPEDWYRRFGARRYGFHGTSHQYVSRVVPDILGRPSEALNIISLHLGNGASAAAIQGGRSIDTSMGMTPLEGLVMGTRPGDVDPGLLLHLLREGVPPQQLEQALNKESGLLGLCGENDLRAVHALAARGDAAAERALAVFGYRVRKYIGAYAAVLGRVDALVFTAGVGENDAAMRARILQGLENLGLRIDPAKNSLVTDGARAIQAADSPTAILVVPTREEQEIARQVAQTLGHVE